MVGYENMTYEQYKQAKAMLKTIKKNHNCETVDYDGLLVTIEYVGNQPGDYDFVCASKDGKSLSYEEADDILEGSLDTIMERHFVKYHDMISVVEREDRY